MTVFSSDLYDRVFWTALQAVVGVVTADLLGLSGEWAIAFTALAAVLKGVIAKRVGDPNTTSTSGVS